MKVKMNYLFVSKYKGEDVFKYNFENVNEAERLQTLPDNYTACLDSKVRRSEVCGNGWTVDVIVHILKGLPNTERLKGETI